MSIQAPTKVELKDMASTPGAANPVKHIAHIFARWYWRGVSGREVLEVEIPKPLAQMIRPHQLQQAGVMRGAHMDDAGCIELRVQQDGKAATRDYIQRAARMLRFLACNGLRPATPAETERTLVLLDGMPGHRVIAAAWVQVETDAWVAAVTTADSATDARAEWCISKGIAYLAPGWSNVWAPGAALPHIFCSDQATAVALAESLEALHAAGPLVWSGPVTTRTAKSSKQASDAPVNGGATRSRPKHSMALERHSEVGHILAALCASRMPPLAVKSIRDVWRVLAEWLPKEHPSSVDRGVIYSGCNKAAMVIDDRAEQIAALDRAVQILEGGYRRSKRRDALTRELRRARARLAVSRAPREQSSARKAA